MKARCFIVFIILLGLFESCQVGNRGNGDIIPVELNESSLVTLNLEEYSYVVIDTPDMIGMIDRVQFMNDRMLLKSKSELTQLSLSGEYLGSISNLGRSSEEYLSILDFGFIGDSIYLYDMDGKKVMLFDVNGQLLHCFPLPQTAGTNSFQLVVPLGKQYIGKRMYCGLPGYPELSLYDENFHYVKDINASNMHLRSGTFFGSQFAPYSSKSVLYNRSFDNRIYEVTRDTAVVRYVVDYGDRSIDIDKFKDEYEIMKKIGTIPNFV